MWSEMTMLLAVLAFLIQLILCFRNKKRWLRLLPVSLAVLGVLLCAAACLVCAWLDWTGQSVYGAVFAAVLYGMIFLILLGGAAAGWTIYAIVKVIQKCRK